MRTINEELKKAAKNNKLIIEKLTKADRMFDGLDFKEWTKELHEESEKLYKDSNELRAENAIIKENVRSLFADSVIEHYQEIIKKYAGKPYGTKTRDKINEELKKYNISMYFDGFSGKYLMKAKLIDEQTGYYKNVCFNGKHYVYIECEFWAIDKDGKSAYFVDENNIIQCPEMKNKYIYTENPKKKITEIKKAFEKYTKAHEKARQAQSELNSLLPKDTRTAEAVKQFTENYIDLFRG